MDKYHLLVSKYVRPTLMIQKAVMILKCIINDKV